MNKKISDKNTKFNKEEWFELIYKILGAAFLTTSLLLIQRMIGYVGL